MQPQTELAAFLQAIVPGDPIAVEGWTLVPLLSPGARAEAALLEEGLAEKTTEVTELTESGIVGNVRVAHGGALPLLLLDGEEIVGAKQNRVLNASFLIAPGTNVSIPVSCVERGRWRYQSKEFAASERTIGTDLRAAKLKRVVKSVHTTQTYDADQSAVWRDVDGALARGQQRSATSAYADAVAPKAKQIEETVEKLTPLQGQVGIAALRGDEVVLMDVLGSADLYRRGWKKIVRGLVAQEAAGTPATAPRERVARALTDAGGAACTRVQAPGVGETVHGTGSGFVVGAVVKDGQVFHAVVARDA